MGVLDSHPVSPRGPILLASADDQLRGAGIPVSPRGTSLADGDGADPGRLASAPRHANQLAAVGFLVFGSLVLAGPYMALKGSIGTKPAIARVLGLAPGSHPQALERERPLPPDQTTLETYRLATERMVKVVRGVVSTPLVPLALLGLVVMPRGPARARTWLFFGVVLLASAIGLVRLHATSGYCTVRHGLVPGLILILAAAHGLTWLMARISIPGDWLGA